jgi:methyl-accepting chemotaxis protein
MKSLSLAQKLGCTFAVALGALVVITTASVAIMKWELQELTDLAHEDMPMAVLASQVDGNLMDQDIEFQRMLRAGWAQHGGATEAGAWLGAAQKTFAELIATSDKDIGELKALIARAANDPDPAVAARYQGLARQVEQIDSLQGTYEQAVGAVSRALDGAQLEQAMAANAAARDARSKTETAIKAFVADIDALVKGNADAAESSITRAISFLLVTALLATLGTAGLGFWIVRSTLKRVALATAAAERIAQADLSGAIAVDVHDEIGRLLDAMRRMQDQLAVVVGTVRGNAESVATASAQIAQGNADLSQRTEEQASSLQQTAASMEQLGTTVQGNADNARQANQLAQGASTVAVQGGEVVTRVVETMKGIQDSSRRIAEIIGVIDGIAFQTNILALNAAVEAARAGEQGRGFAVVAGEVRSLAQRSAEAAREIKSLIGASVERVGEGSQLVEQAGSTMQEVVASIRRVTDIVGEITSASGEQAAGVTQVGQAVSQMDQVTQQNAALVEESAAAAESLKLQAQQLVAAVAAFKLAHAV